MHDAVVVGGGPAGSRVARLLAKNHDVKVIEEHSVSGIPVQCAGLISDAAAELSGVKVDVLNSLHGAYLHFPSGGVLHASSKIRKAIVIDRADMDGKMADAAMDAGADFQYKCRYISHRTDDHVHVNTDNGVIDAEMIIGADGYRSKVSSSIPGNEPKEYVRGYQMDVRHRSDDMENVHIYVGSRSAPGFFSWVVPFDDMVRVGLCSSMDALPPIEYAKNIIRRAGLQDSAIIKKYCGMVPLGGRKRTYGERMMLIGDAAGQVKPISGGGVYPALRSADHLARTFSEAFQENDMSSGFLSRYQSRWRSELGEEMRNGYFIRRLYKRLDDRSLDRIYEIMDRKDIMSVVEDINIDRPSDIAAPIMKKASVFISMVPAVLGSIIRGNRD